MVKLNLTHGPPTYLSTCRSSRGRGGRIVSIFQHSGILDLRGCQVGGRRRAFGAHFVQLCSDQRWCGSQVVVIRACRYIVSYRKKGLIRSKSITLLVKQLDWTGYMMVFK
jgi:hypothetical protein